MNASAQSKCACNAVISGLLLFIGLGLLSCSNSGDSAETPPPATSFSGTATINGAVSGTIIKVVNASTHAVLAQTDTASQPGPPPFTFSLGNIPIGVPIKLYFFSAGQTFTLVMGSPTTNVFTIQSSGAIGLGSVTLNTGGMNAVPESEPTSVLLGPPDFNVPPGITPPPATLTAQTPALGEGIVNFNVQNFAIGGEGQQHLHVRIGSGPVRHFYNGPTRAVKEDSGAQSAEVVWHSVDAFRLNLPVGTYTINVWLATATHGQFVNSEANPPSIIVTVTNPSPPPPPPPPPPAGTGVVVTSGNSFLSSPVRITFSVSNFTIGSPGAPHMRFTIDNGPPNDFYIGTANDPDLGVQRNGQHTHFAHWISATSFDLFSLSAGPHSIRLALVDAFNAELPNLEAKTIHDFTVEQPPSGNLSLQSVLSGLNFPSALAQAQDGRVFFNELGTGNIRVANIVNSIWQAPNLFCPNPLALSTGGEQGLLGLALDPNFSSNQSLFVYYTRLGFTNRVSKITNVGSECSETVVLDNLPTAGNHNGGIIQFGPDGKLYIIIGDAGSPSDAQNLDSLAGKILRINPDGTAPSDNPFYSDGTANRDKVFSFGHRNSFGFTFHPQTNELWESENGPSSPEFDEVNRVLSGNNYGWDSSGQSGCRFNPPFIDPVVQFSIFAPTGIVGIPANSTIYPSAFQNNLLVGGFNDGTIRLVIANPSSPCGSGNTSVAYPGNVGGLISLMLASDGYVYVSSVNGVIYRVIPH
jgi:aldose sugar dehydrogenase